MKIEIKHRKTGEVLFTHEQQDNIAKLTVEAAIKAGAYLGGANLEVAYLEVANLEVANLIGANLGRANLGRANLGGANLEVANLSGANLSGATYGVASMSRGVVQLLGKYWLVFVFDEHIKIGCRLHKTCEWENFSDQEIAQMDSKALEFWNENKEMILMIASNHQR